MIVAYRESVCIAFNDPSGPASKMQIDIQWSGKESNFNRTRNFMLSHVSSCLQYKSLVILYKKGLSINENDHFKKVKSSSLLVALYASLWATTIFDEDHFVILRF